MSRVLREQPTTTTTTTEESSIAASEAAISAALQQHQRRQRQYTTKAPTNIFVDKDGKSMLFHFPDNLKASDRDFYRALIIEHGGVITSNPTPTTIYLNNDPAAGGPGSVKFAYIDDCVAKKRLLSRDGYTSTVGASAVATSRSGSSGNSTSNSSSPSRRGHTPFTPEKDEFILEQVRLNPRYRNSHVFFAELAKNPILKGHTGNSIRSRFRKRLESELQFVYKVDSKQKPIKHPETGQYIKIGVNESPKTLLSKYTPKDDYCLCKAAKKYLLASGYEIDFDEPLILPNAFFRAMERKWSHHSWSSWRDRYKKRVKPGMIPIYIAYVKECNEVGEEPKTLLEFGKPDAGSADEVAGKETTIEQTSVEEDTNGNGNGNAQEPNSEPIEQQDEEMQEATEATVDTSKSDKIEVPTLFYPESEEEDEDEEMVDASEELAVEGQTEEQVAQGGEENIVEKEAEESIVEKEGEVPIEENAEHEAEEDVFETVERDADEDVFETVPATLGQDAEEDFDQEVFETVPATLGKDEEMDDAAQEWMEEVLEEEDQGEAVAQQTEVSEKAGTVEANDEEESEQFFDVAQSQPARNDEEGSQQFHDVAQSQPAQIDKSPTRQAEEQQELSQISIVEENSQARIDIQYVNESVTAEDLFTGDMHEIMDKGTIYSRTKAALSQNTEAIEIYDSLSKLGFTEVFISHILMATSADIALIPIYCHAVAENIEIYSSGNMTAIPISRLLEIDDTSGLWTLMQDLRLFTERESELLEHHSKKNIKDRKEFLKSIGIIDSDVPVKDIEEDISASQDVASSQTPVKLEYAQEPFESDDFFDVDIENLVDEGFLEMTVAGALSRVQDVIQIFVNLEKLGFKEKFISHLIFATNADIARIPKLCQRIATRMCEDLLQDINCKFRLHFEDMPGVWSPSQDAKLNTPREDELLEVHSRRGINSRKEFLEGLGYL
ncbi:uncharacterized protein J8A68_003272 [[Candida] subhashii]|uniref:DNA-binding protein RAP1 n=1 Tax=[Candida] subhashii TaxID=561895 RepID=A0A8J5QVX1_9ASCO|nr:uncharacterized protein J8A68_003272 [[Candida] subhashii]KAG7663190.1 hypothetical protein J8A68_003272 [[Candida] subhashii]